MNANTNKERCEGIRDLLAQEIRSGNHETIKTLARDLVRQGQTVMLQEALEEAFREMLISAGIREGAVLVEFRKILLDLDERQKAEIPELMAWVERMNKEPTPNNRRDVSWDDWAKTKPMQVLCFGYSEIENERCIAEMKQKLVDAIVDNNGEEMDALVEKLALARQYRTITEAYSESMSKLRSFHETNTILCTEISGARRSIGSVIGIVKSFTVEDWVKLDYCVLCDLCDNDVIDVFTKKYTTSEKTVIRDALSQAYHETVRQSIHEARKSIFKQLFEKFDGLCSDAGEKSGAHEGISYTDRNNCGG